MATWTNYFRIITPVSRNEVYSKPVTATLDSGVNLNNSSGYAALSTMGWFLNVLKGPGNRLQLYKQYENMDESDVARALDIIAEEMTSGDNRTNLPFIIDYQIEENLNVSDSTITTLRAALRIWSTLHDLNQRLFTTGRKLIKYGDCFFRKKSDTQPWEYVDATRIVGIEINENLKIIAYHIRPSNFKIAATSVNAFKSNSTGNVESLEIVPAEAIIHFSMSDDMGDSAPFGTSILQPAYKDWQKLSMLEDASIIFRIVRAPERRVFYIDVGNQPAQRINQYLEQIKNSIRQKRIPNVANANQVDSMYNPESIQEDYFFPVTAAGRGSRVETLPGGVGWEMPELDYFLNKVFRALRVPSAYMRGSDAAGAQYNDGKVGIAAIEELRFVNYVERIQRRLETIYDEQFKLYLKATGINIDFDIFKLKLPPPQNFAIYRQAALDADLINSFNSIEQTKYLSRRFILKRYLQLTEDDIQMNEVLLKQERDIRNKLESDDIRQIYDPAVYENRASINVTESPLSGPATTGPDFSMTPETPPAGETPPTGETPPAGETPST